jgi:hypothetical protein
LKTNEIKAGVGLCSSCRHAKTVTSDKGSVFWRCLLAERDKSFSKYPQLPVLVCGGFESSGR